MKPIQGQKREIEFDLSVYRDIKALRFDPHNDVVALRLNTVQLITNDSRVIPLEACQTNACYQHGRNLIFNTPAPQIVFDSPAEHAQKLVITLEYIAAGAAAYPDMLHQKDAELAQQIQMLHQKDAELAQQIQMLHQKDAELAQQTQMIQHKDAELAQQIQMLHQKDAELAQQIQMLHQKDAELAQQALTIQHKDAKLHEKIQLIQCMENTLSWKITQPLRALRNHRVIIRGSHTIRKVFNKIKLKLKISQDILFMCCDKVEMSMDALTVVGWAIATKGIQRIEISLDGILLGEAQYGISRLDVGNVYPHIKQSATSGFHFTGFFTPSNRSHPTYTVLIRTITCDGQTDETIKRVTVQDHRISLRMVLADFCAAPQSMPAFAVERPIDIIVPVYNGFECLERLLSSLFKHTSLPYRLLVIDDCSTDPRVRTLLKQAQAQNAHVVLLENEENLGFVKSANKAVQQTQNHFVLLNTDTEVPPYWLERLMFPIFQSENIASTTPFTNCGTLMSFPNFMEDNPLFEGLSVEALDQFFQCVKPHQNYIELPTGVGFCMGFNKQVVERIGMFDAETFGRGYGEENDWCMRAKQAGFKNVAVPNLFVYHKYGGSFPSEEKKILIRSNLARLFQRYPDYERLIAEFVEQDPLRQIREFLTLGIYCNKHTSRTVFIIDHDIGGGANYYRQQIIDHYKSQAMNVLLLTYRDGYFLRYEQPKKRGQYRLSDVDDIVRLLEFVQVQDIWINDLVSFPDPLSFIQRVTHLVQQRAYRLTLPIQDYFAICPSYTLLNTQEQFCDIPADLQECRRCLQHNPLAWAPRSSLDIALWRQTWAELLRCASEIRCFSPSSQHLLQRAYPFLTDAPIQLIPHIVEGFKPVIRHTRHTHTVNIGVLGAINLQKGRKIITAILNLITAKALHHVQIVVIGEIDLSIEHPHLVVTGPYQRASLPQLVEHYAIDLVLILSIWPETFSYTTEEAIKMGLPVAVFNLGAQAERVRTYEKGLIIEHIDPEYALDSILDW